MKSKNVALSVAMAVVGVVSQSAAADSVIQPPTLTTIAADYIFAPPGFDSNDNAQIVIHGQLPSTCFKTVQPVVRVDHASRKVYVSALAYSYTGCFCLHVMTPFTQTVDLGIMNAGGYRILEVDSSGRSTARGVLPIAVNKTAEPDEVLYAPVKSAIIEKSGNQNVLHLSGAFSSDCLELQRVVTLHRASRIIEVLPLAIRKPGVACTPRNRPFESRIALSASDPGENLIHIRSMNGNSVNLIEEF